MKIRKDDRVIVMAGKDIGATGRVIKVDPAKNRVLVEGVNRVKRHEKIRPTQRGGQTGGITEKEAWIDASNVQIVSPDDGKPTRVAYRMDDGNKIRVCARTGAKL
ncbi:MAG TPA: 50S ribosomal protein L24 [Actinomycetes bacterium]|nr:50S ribosomal protein L24 [Actinomycetes bacterium]